MKAKKIAMCTLAVLALASVAQADLETIGTATYGGSDYNLIWQPASNGFTSLVWLDYSSPTAYWGDQKNWAAGLDTSPTSINIDSAYSVDWASSSWRLPTAGSHPAIGWKVDTTQEMGHLYYDGLGFTGGSSNAGATAPDLAGSIFNNLALTAYWTSTPDDPTWGTNTAWMFAFKETRSTPYNDNVYGYQDIDWAGTNWLSSTHSGLAVRGADVTQGTPVVPVPGAFLLGSLGLGFAAWRMKRRKMA